MYESVQLIPGYLRVDDESNPGFLFTIDQVTTNRFFYISKGRQRNDGPSSPLYCAYEQVSPTAGSNAQVTTDLAGKMRDGEVYSALHDCANVRTIENKGHYFTLSGEGAASGMTNLSIFMPDKRYQSTSQYESNHAPRVFLYKAELKAEATPNEQQPDMFDIRLDWSTWFNKEKINADATEQFYVYITKENGEVLTGDDGQPLLLMKYVGDKNFEFVTNAITGETTREKTTTYRVPQRTEAQTFTYVVTANPIELADDGTTVKNASSIFVNTNTATVTIPGMDAFFAEAAGYRSRYEVNPQLNVYENTISVKPNSDTYYAAINCEENNYTLYRDDVAVASLSFTQAANGTYDYKVAYDENTQDLTNLFNPQKTPILQANIDRNGIITFIDRFSVSTESNTHPEAYQYRLIQANGTVVSNAQTVPVHKSTNEADLVGTTQTEINADTDHHLEQPGNVAVTFLTAIDDRQTITDYTARRTNEIATYIGKAEHTQNDNFSLIGQNAATGAVNEDLGSQAVGGGKELTTVDHRDLLRVQKQSYVTLISARVNHSVDGNNVLNTYGSDISTVDLPYLKFDAVNVMKSNPFPGKYGPVMSYAAELRLTPDVPADIDGVYLYRIWRVMPNGTELLLNGMEENKGTSEMYPDATDNTWCTTYGNLTPATEPSREKEVSVSDIFIGELLKSGQSRSVNYIARMYTYKKPTAAAPVRRRVAAEGDLYYVTERVLTVTYDDHTVTGLEAVSDAREAVGVTYYNTLGQAGQTPWAGVNVVVTRHADGTTSTHKFIQ
ncbi:MAG: hypothetical protein IJ808_02660 [Muribaculaceae bacterium]|nr:hypothetical protein [Muribaculaceae bacterium]